MKVAFVTSFPTDPGRPHGGVEAVSVTLVDALQRTGQVELHVVTTDPQCPSQQTSQWNGIQIHRLPRLGRKVLQDAIGPGRRLVSEYVSQLRPDLIHAHDVYGLMVQGLAIPRVFTVHGFIYGDTLVSGTRLAWLRSRIWKHYETEGWADQPNIICISPYVRERLTGLTHATLYDIDNPISSGFFDLPRQERQGVVFCAAVLCKRKNQLALVDAARILRDRGISFDLRLAGVAHEPAYGEEIQRRIERADLQDCVHMLGRLGQEQIRTELTAASVFALVSLEENSPMGIEEAMAAGVPVVTSNRCGMPYMVRHGESGLLVDPLNVENVAEALATVLTHAELRQQMGQVGRQIALDRFHADNVARRTINVYHAVERK